MKNPCYHFFNWLQNSQIQKEKIKKIPRYGDSRGWEALREGWGLVSLVSDVSYI